MVAVGEGLNPINAITWGHRTVIVLTVTGAVRTTSMSCSLISHDGAICRSNCDVTRRIWKKVTFYMCHNVQDD